MSTSFESLAVLLILLPGFLASLTFSALQERREASALRQFMEALAFSFTIQLILAALGREPAIVPRVHEGEVDGVLVRAGGLAWSAAFALSLPVALSTAIERDLLLSLARRVGITTRTGRASVWLDVLSEEAHVMLHFRDGRKVIGWPSFYSDSAEEGMIFLQSPTWVSEDGARIPMNVDGLFACNRSELKFLTIVRDWSPS
jgi:hypothetical protein